MVHNNRKLIWNKQKNNVKNVLFDFLVFLSIRLYSDTVVAVVAYWWINWNTLPLQIWNVTHPSAVTRDATSATSSLHGADFLLKIKVKQTNKKVPGSVWRRARLTVYALVYGKRSSAKVSPPTGGKPGRRMSQEVTNAGRHYCPPRWRNMTDLGLAPLACWSLIGWEVLGTGGRPHVHVTRDSQRLGGHMT